MPRFLTLHEAASVLHLKQYEVIELVERGALTAEQKGNGRPLFFEAHDVSRYLRSVEGK